MAALVMAIDGRAGEREVQNIAGESVARDRGSGAQPAVMGFRRGDHVFDSGLAGIGKVMPV